MLNEIAMPFEKQNNYKLFEEIIKPRHTYEVFYFMFFGKRWELNFHSNLKGQKLPKEINPSTLLYFLFFLLKNSMRFNLC